MEWRHFPAQTLASLSARRILLGIILLALLLGGVALRRYAWEQTTHLRYQQDIANGFYWGNQTLVEGRRLCPGEKPDSWRTFARGYLGLYDRVQADAYEENYYLDYPPLRLLVMSIWAKQVRAKFPGVPVVAYVNTSADVKAEVDICCTSSNALEVVESLGADTVIFLPDQYLAKYVAAHTKVKIIAWKGACEVHERFTADELRGYRAGDPSLQIIAHPECPPDVIAEADYTGSTAGMIDWVRKNRPRRVVMVTECSMADNVQAELPDVEFVRPCNLCPHMKRITLPKILDSLVYLKEEVVIDPVIAAKARRSVEAMVNLKR